MPETNLRALRPTPLLSLLFMLAGLAPVLAADVGDTQRVSVDSAGGEASLPSAGGAVSEDGRYVVFDSLADDLVPGDVNGARDVFLHDRVTGQTTLVSLRFDGTQADGDSFDPRISADGRYVVFTSEAANLDQVPVDGYRDVFVRDLHFQTTYLVSVSSNPSDGPSEGGRLSANGKFVVYASRDSQLESGGPGGGEEYENPDGNWEVLLAEINASQGSKWISPVHPWISASSNDGDSRSPSVSADGRFVAFESDATTLVLDDQNGDQDVFVYDTFKGEMRRVTDGNGPSFEPGIAREGRRVVFASEASNLVVGDTNGVADVFLADLWANSMERVSVSSDGVQSDAASGRPVTSSNGRRVAFESSATNLVMGDTGFVDVFVHDDVSGLTERVSVPSSGAAASGSSDQPAISEDGDIVVFRSDASNLVSADTNGAGDVFVRELAPAPAPTEPQRVLASSETHLTVAPVQPSGIGTWVVLAHPSSGGQDLVVYAKVGQPVAARRYFSGPEQVQLTTAGTDGHLQTGELLVFGTTPHAGAVSGEQVIVHGYNLLGVKAAPQVSLGGATMSSVAEVSNTTLTGTSAPGANVFDNPLGPVDVVVVSDYGAKGELAGGHVYAPAIEAAEPPSVGSSWKLEVHVQPGDLFVIFFGESVPGLAIPIPPLAGALEVLLGFDDLTSLLSAPSDRFALNLPVPANPALVGVLVELQAAVLTSVSPLGGAFTNRLETVIES